jgi:phosphoglycolate phosphatase-like HAD superfamily hydrolase
VADGLAALRAATPNVCWLIVSGGDQNELRQIFSARGLAHFFDGGIYGGPDSKNVILKREVDRGTIVQPALYAGDSRYDFQAASEFGLDFVFVSGWTEMSDWASFVQAQGIRSVRNVAKILE